MNTKFYCFVFLFSLKIIGTNAQVNTSIPDKSIPIWISMMNDSSVNYYEAIAAFEAYWQVHPRPIEEHDRMLNVEKLSESIDSNPTEAKYEVSNIPYAFEYKRFIHWKNKVEPFVLSDGRIMSKNEQLHLWQEMQKERK